MLNTRCFTSVALAVLAESTDQAVYVYHDFSFRHAPSKMRVR